MKVVLGIVCLMAIVLVGYRRTFTRLPLPIGAQHLFLTGTEFILVGLFLGDSFLGVLDEATIRVLHPFLIVGLGWIGLLVGCQLDLRRLLGFPRDYLLAALGEGGFVFSLVFLLFTFLPSPGSFLREELPWPAVMVLSVTAVCTAFSSLAMMGPETRRAGKRMKMTREFLQLSSVMDDLVGLVGFGVLCCFVTEGFRFGGVEIASGYRLVYSVCLGLFTGIVFNALLRLHLSHDETLLILIGAAAVNGALAFFFRVSPLFTNFISGLVIGNLPGEKERFLRLLIAAEKPFYVILLIVAGALWQPGIEGALGLAAVYVVARGGGKWAGGFGFSRVVRTPMPLPPSIGLGLISQGGLAVAILINFRMFRDTPSVNLAMSVILFSIFVNELVSPYLSRRVMKRAR